MPRAPRTAPATTELLKGCTELVVLRLLSERPRYGYDLVQELRRRSDGAFGVAQGTVYPLLYAMERKGLVRAQWATDEGPRRRKYYTLTARGRAAVGARIAEWESFVAGMARLLAAGGRPARAR